MNFFVRGDNVVEQIKIDKLVAQPKELEEIISSLIRGASEIVIDVDGTLSVKDKTAYLSLTCSKDFIVIYGISQLSADGVSVDLIAPKRKSRILIHNHLYTPEPSKTDIVALDKLNAQMLFYFRGQPSCVARLRGKADDS